MDDAFIRAYFIVSSLLVATVIAYTVWINIRGRGHWRTVIEGELGRVEYGLNRDIVAIYFFHGDSIVISDEHLRVPFLSGTKIKVQRNGRGRHRVREA